MSFDLEDDQEGIGSKPEDLLSAARSCQAVLILLLLIFALLAGALIVYLIN